MWEMFDPDFDCGNECGPGPPPVFFIPAPPRPPFLSELTKCSEDILIDIEMCEAIPILDASYHSSPSLQTSAMIVLSSVILVLVVLLSSLLVWKHKRKVQNFLPCKTPTRGVHLDPNGLSGGHSVTYEDPDAHLGHRPLVMRHHHNIEMLHPKAIHFPSGFPMTNSPPLFVCSSPGPDPYRSNDNVYEELGPPRDSDIESEPRNHSDDDFAEDELSLPGERSFNKTSPDNTIVATIYHERAIPDGIVGAISLERSTNERNSLLSSSSSNGIRNSSPERAFRCSRKIHQNRNGKIPTNYSADELNTSSEHDGLPTIYNNDRNMMTLPYNLSNNVRNDVERRNQINTIFRGGRPYNQQQQQIQPTNRSRTNPRSLDRRRQIRQCTNQTSSEEQSYGYTEPVFHEGILYDTSCLAHDRNHIYHPYILPEFTSFRTNGPNHHSHQQPQQIYSRDSSFGSDSGYSHHTQTTTSSRGGGVLAGWGRRLKETQNKNNTYECS